MTSPVRVARIALPVAVVTGLGSLAMLTAWALNIGTERPHLILMVYLALVEVSLGATVVYVSARMQIATALAFAHGVAHGARNPVVQRGKGRGLRAVD